MKIIKPIKNLYYTVEKELQPTFQWQPPGKEEVEETTGWKTITIYDIDTQNMIIIEVAQFRAKNSSSTEDEIYTYLENNNDDDQYNLIEL